jgi:1-acyl-sn-glycerol-3-phosphate acyltransferase
VSLSVLRRKLVAHLHAVRGLRRLPRDGPAIIVANHRSDFDSLAIVGLVRLLYGRRVRVPTKVIAFRSWARGVLHRAWGCVPIDPERPDEAYEAVASLLRQGEIVLLFPEGRRSLTNDPLPFRYGAFNLAVRLGVPIIAVALRGSADVIPKGRLWFVRGATASLAVARPIDPRPALASGEDPERLARRLRDQVQAAIARVVAADRDAIFDDAATGREAAWFGDRIDVDIEGLLDKGVETIAPDEARDVMTLASLARRVGRDALRFRVQYARAYGFWLRSIPRSAALAFLPGYRRLVEASLAVDPREPYLNYCMGQYHLQVPRWLGGDVRRAVSHMRAAYRNARAYGADPARFAVGLATALVAAGRGDDAALLIDRHFAGVAAGEGPRLRRRRQRAAALVTRLEGVPPSWCADADGPAVHGTAAGASRI